MLKIIYVSFEPGGGYDLNEIVPEMCEEQFDSLEEAQEFQVLGRHPRRHV